MKKTSVSIGAQKERSAAHYLQKKGYKILQFNYRRPVGEIDIIAQVSGIYVFVEVKSRSSLDFGLPEEFVNNAKKRKIVKTACCYIKENALDNADFRFDVVSISPCGLEHYEGAFDSEGYCV